MNATAHPKSPVTWVIELEMNEQEVAAWKLFAYRFRDGVVQHGLTGNDADVFNNTASPLYDALETAAQYIEP